MSHFAELNEENFVVRTIVGDDSMPNEGYDWIVENLGGRWIKTSYNTYGNKHLLGGTPLRGNFGQPGTYYDEELDVFYEPDPQNGWIFNSETYLWEPPVLPPNDGNPYVWDAETLSWVDPGTLSE